MKSARLSLAALACLCLLPLTASAHHEGDPIGALIDQTSALNLAVQQSWLSPNVKSAVQHFAGDINLIEGCEMLPSPVSDHQGPSCRDEVQHVQAAWYRVQRYLYDTNFDFPHVYQHYLNTQYAVQNALAYMGH
jgi:hypothetical protein